MSGVSRSLLSGIRPAVCLLLAIGLLAGCGDQSGGSTAGDSDDEAAVTALARDYLEAAGRGDGSAICSISAPELLALWEANDCGRHDPDPSAPTITVVGVAIPDGDVSLVTVRREDVGDDALLFQVVDGKIVGVSSTEVSGAPGGPSGRSIVELSDDRRPAVSAVSDVLGALSAGDAAKVCAELDRDAALGLLRGLQSLYADDGHLPSSATCVEHIERAEAQQRQHYDEPLVDPVQGLALSGYAERQAVALVTGSARDESGDEVEGQLLTAIQREGRWTLLALPGL